MAVKIGLHVRGEPFPVLLRQVHEPYVRLAVFLDRAAEIDRAADHAHAGTVAQDVLGVPGIHAADHGNAAGLELGKGIAHAAEVPGLEVREPGVLLGHGVAPRAAAALDVELALGPRVMCAVRHVAEHGDRRAAVEPARVVGRRTLDHDLGVVHAHAAHALSRRALDGDLHLAVLRPDASADAVLTVCNNGDIPGAVLDGLLDLLFEVFRRDTFSVDIALDYHYSLKKR